MTLFNLFIGAFFFILPASCILSTLKNAENLCRTETTSHPTKKATAREDFRGESKLHAIVGVCAWKCVTIWGMNFMRTLSNENLVRVDLTFSS